MLAGRVDSGCAKHSSSRGRTRRCTSRAQPCRPGKTPACSLSSALCPLSTLLLLLLLLLLRCCSAAGCAELFSLSVSLFSSVNPRAGVAPARDHAPPPQGRGGGSFGVWAAGFDDVLLQLVL